MALGTGSWFPHGPGHDVEAGHEDDVPRGLEADDALLLALVLYGSTSSFLRDLRRRGGEGVVHLAALAVEGRVAAQAAELDAHRSTTRRGRPLWRRAAPYDPLICLS